MQAVRIARILLLSCILTKNLLQDFIESYIALDLITTDKEAVGFQVKLKCVWIAYFMKRTTIRYCSFICRRFRL